MTWVTAGGSVVGPAHRHAGRGCEDAFLVSAEFSGDLLVAAVADGAGSAARAAEGAACVVTAACAALRSWRATSTLAVTDISDDVAHGWLAAVRAAVESHAVYAGIPLGDLAATCLLTVADASGALALQIGDGGVAVRAAVAPSGQAADGWTPLTWPLRGEYANETVFITSIDWRAAVQIERTGPVSAVALFSDGFEVLALNYRERRVNAHLLDPLANHLRTVGSGVAQAELDAAMVGYLSSAAFDEHAFDDRTLVLACVIPPPESAQSEHPVLDIFSA